jgi:hypothetical protein
MKARGHACSLHVEIEPDLNTFDSKYRGLIVLTEDRLGRGDAHADPSRERGLAETEPGPKAFKIPYFTAPGPTPADAVAAALSACLRVP